MSQSVQAGNSIKLRTQFLDDQNNPTEPTSVSIFLFEPDVDSTVLENYTVSGQPTYLGNGIEEYEWNVAEDVTPGIWTPRWIGVINGQTLDNSFELQVTNSGEIIELPSQVFQNNLIEITIHSGIEGVDGSVLTEEYVFQFLTTVSPNYSAPRKIKLEYGGFLPDIEDDTIQLAILEASLEADELNFASTVKNTDFFKHVRREWVTCKAALTLINNLNNSLIKSKRLGDFSVTYDTNTLRDAMSKAWDCMNKWEPQLMAGGFYKAAQQPSRVVKGEYDPDRRLVGRDWSGPGELQDDNGFPGANTKSKHSTERRYKSIFSRTKKYW